jgi:hypothetical protein
MNKDLIIESFTKAILFEDSGSIEGWEDNLNLGQAAFNAMPAGWVIVPTKVTKDMRMEAWEAAASITPRISKTLDILWEQLLKGSEKELSKSGGNNE